MKNKFFSIKKDNLHYILTVLGIRFKIKNVNALFKAVKELQKRQLSLRSAELFFLGEEKYSINERIWLLSQEFYEVVGYYPDFKHPQTFNEKLNWLKLYYYNPTENTCIDKHTMKQWVKDKIGDEHVIPLIGVYYDVNDIDFKNLPEKFVVKTPFDGGALGVWIVKDKKKLNTDKLKYEINNSMQKWHSLYYRFLSRGYKEIEPKIIVEKYLEQPDEQLYDYKIFCFHGEAKFIEAIKDRKNGKFKASFYDTYWRRLDLHSGKKKDSLLKEPKNFEKMLEIAKVLSSEFPFVRVDLYNVKGKIYVGEMSFTPASGFMKFSSVEFDYLAGEWLDLTKINPKYLKSN